VLSNDICELLRWRHDLSPAIQSPALTRWRRSIRKGGHEGIPRYRERLGFSPLPNLDKAFTISEKIWFLSLIIKTTRYISWQCILKNYTNSQIQNYSKKEKKTVEMISTLDTPKIRPLSRPLCIPSNSQLFLDFFHIILTAKMWILVETIQLYPMKTTRILCALLVLPEMTLTFDFQAECHLLIYINYFCREISLIKTKLSLNTTRRTQKFFFV
jgi:hypothetical protein